MDIIRRNTDYALCLMIHLAEQFDREPVSTKQMSKQEKIPYSLACKLMQTLQKAKLVSSVMGPTGGFKLNKNPEDTNVYEIIETIQGPMCLNRCLTKNFDCPRESRCPIKSRLHELQGYLKMYLENINLAELVNARNGQ